MLIRNNIKEGETHQKAEQSHDALVGDPDDEGGAGGGHGPVGAGRGFVQAARARERLGAGRRKLGRRLQPRRGLGGRAEALCDLDEAVGGHLILKQQRLSPFFGQSPPSAG